MIRKKSAVLLRGAIGGALGGFLYSLTLPKFHLIFGSGQYYLVLLFIIPITTILGAAIGLIIWWLHIKYRRNIGAVLRAVIGASLAITFAVIISIIGTINSHYDKDKSQWGRSEIIYLAILGILVGALPAIIVGTQNQTERE